MANNRGRSELRYPIRCQVWRLWLCAAFVPAIAFSQATWQAHSDALDEVIVTARKIEESVQDVSMSVQVLSTDLLDTLDLTRLYDLQFSVPGLVVNNLGLHGAGFSLRGVADGSVAPHLNGVYLGSSRLAIARTFDLRRIEVLKGPQGTLYGRNATGGSIKFITQLPLETFSAGVEAAYGSFDTARAQGHVNLPFDRTSLRFAFIGSEGDGFIRNSIDDRRFAEDDFWGLRGSLLFDVNDRLRLTLTAQRVEDDGASGELWLPQPDFLVDPSDIRLAEVTLEDPFLVIQNDTISAEFEYDFGFGSFHSITGYAQNTTRDLDDCAGLPFLRDCVRSALPSKYDQVSQEFRLASRAGTSADWLVGVFYFDADASSKYYQLTPAVDPNPTNDRFSTSDETAFAIFGQASWHFAEKWSVTAGLRLNKDQHKESTIGTGTRDSRTLATAEEDWENNSWRLDLQYAVADDVLIYGNISTGFKSGGIAILPDGGLDSFGPEELIAYEAGAKSQWRDRRLTLNGAVFYYDFRDLQVNTFTVTDDGLIFEVDNAARAEIYGVDLDGAFRIGDRLTVSGGLVWLPKRQFVEYRNDQTGDTLSGNKLVRSPEWTATAALEYEQPLRQSGMFSARIEYNYRSAFFYTTDNDPRFAQDSFGLLNVFFKFEPTAENWYLFVSGRNLGDVDYFNQVFLQSSPGYPDTYEAGFGFRF